MSFQDGRAPGEVLSVESELARLMQSTYPPAQLLQRPLPEGVDPTSLELYLSPQHFQVIKEKYMYIIIMYCFRLIYLFIFNCTSSFNFYFFIIILKNILVSFSHTGIAGYEYRRISRSSIVEAKRY